MKYFHFSAVFAALLLCGCGYDVPRNTDYLARLGGLLVNYQFRFGDLPADIETAVSSSGERLRNRGDYYGNSVVYIRFPPGAFMIRSYGPNDSDDKGIGDDVDVYFVNDGNHWMIKATQSKLRQMSCRIFELSV